MQKIYIVLPFILLIVLVACERQPSVEQYAKDICNAELSSLVGSNKPYSTWGQFREDTQKVVDEIEKLTPPPELEEFHQATLKVWREMVRLFSRYDQGAVIRDAELLNLFPRITELSEEVDRTIEELPREVFEQFTSVEC